MLGLLKGDEREMFSGKTFKNGIDSYNLVIVLCYKASKHRVLELETHGVYSCLTLIPFGWKKVLHEIHDEII